MLKIEQNRSPKLENSSMRAYRVKKDEVVKRYPMQ
nr:MAG TPA: hypothetical protein [Caudoviricetes sp.]